MKKIKCDQCGKQMKLGEVAKCKIKHSNVSGLRAILIPKEQEMTKFDHTPAYVCECGNYKYIQ